MRRTFWMPKPTASRTNRSSFSKVRIFDLGFHGRAMGVELTTLAQGVAIRIRGGFGFRQAGEAAEIAPVRHADSQVAQDASARIDQEWGVRWCFEANGPVLPSGDKLHGWRAGRPPVGRPP